MNIFSRVSSIFNYSNFPLNLYLEQLILTPARLSIKRNVVFINICFTSKTHPLPGIFSIVAFGSCDSKGSLCFSHTGNAIFCMRRNCLKQGVRNLHSAWSYGAAGTCNNKSVYPRAYMLGSTHFFVVLARFASNDHAL